MSGISLKCHWKSPVYFFPVKKTGNYWGYQSDTAANIAHPKAKLTNPSSFQLCILEIGLSRMGLHWVGHI